MKKISSISKLMCLRNADFVEDGATRITDKVWSAAQRLVDHASGKKLPSRSKRSHTLYLHNKRITWECAHSSTSYYIELSSPEEAVNIWRSLVGDFIKVNNLQD